MGAGASGGMRRGGREHGGGGHRRGCSPERTLLAPGCFTPFWIDAEHTCNSSSKKTRFLKETKLKFPVVQSCNGARVLLFTRHSSDSLHAFEINFLNLKKGSALKEKLPDTTPANENLEVTAHAKCSRDTLCVMQSPFTPATHPWKFKVRAKPKAPQAHLGRKCPAEEPKQISLIHGDSP